MIENVYGYTMKKMAESADLLVPGVLFLDFWGPDEWVPFFDIK